MKTEVYELNSRLVAFERDEDPIQKSKHTFYILDENLKVHQVEKSETRDAYECTRTFDYTKHKMDGLIENDWS